jgi:HlyD family secretion protein
MAKGDQTFYTLIVAALASVGIAYYAPRLMQQRVLATPQVVNGPERATVATATTWAASAPGRIEPQSGELRVSASVPGRIAEVLAKQNDVVAAGELIARLEDAEIEGRIAALEADIGARKRERDQETVSTRAQERRTAEDNAATADRIYWASRAEFDRVTRSFRSERATTEDMQRSRDALQAARERAEQTRAQLRRVIAADGLPAPTRLEVALTAARAELTAAEAQLERTRIRAPRAGTILSVPAVVGDIAAPSPETFVALLGDVRTLRVRAELDERDVGKIRVGQGAVIRVDAFPGRDFEGRVTQIAQALQPGRLSQKGPRRTTDVDVLEVLIDLGPQALLLSGMRADVFIRPLAQATARETTPSR